VTANTAYTWLQRHKRHRAQPLTEVEDMVGASEATSDHPEDAVVNSELRQRLVGAVESLPLQYRTVVVLKDIYGLPHEEIAESLGISTTACKVRLFRARRRLREVLFEEDGQAKVAGL
jgi:RNA polymerase sigma-70 factor (ECF subfamily)